MRFALIAFINFIGGAVVAYVLINSHYRYNSNCISILLHESSMKSIREENVKLRELIYKADFLCEQWKHQQDGVGVNCRQWLFFRKESGVL